MKLRKLSGAVLAFVLAAASAPLLAQGSEQPIKLVVPFAPGGASDMVGRLLAEKVSKVLGRTMVVDNRTGAGGNIGSAAVAAAAPDGSMLLLNGTAPLAISVLTGKPMPFDPFKDLTPIGIVTRMPNVVAVNASLPIHSVQELVAYAKANPKKLSYGISGIGNLSHLNGEMFAGAAGISLLAVPYRGSSAVITDLLGGNVQLSFDNLPPYLAHIESGKLRALAVTSASRSPLLPNAPALAEVGFEGFDNPAIFAIWGPKGMSPQMAERYSKAFSAAILDPEVVAQLKPKGVEPAPSSPEALAARLRKERDNYAQIIKSANIKFE